MKNVFLKILCLTLVFVMLIPAFTACNEQQQFDASEDERAETTENIDDIDAFTLIEKIDAAMDEPTSYKLDMNMVAKFYMSAAEAYVDVSVTGTETETEKGTDGYYYLDEVTSVMSFEAAGQKQTTTVKSVSGFQDGKMFIMTDNGDNAQKVQKLYSEISAADYVEHKKALEEKTSENDFDISRDTCKDTKCAYDKDSKQWVASFSGFTDEGIKKMDLGFSDIAAYMDEDYEFSDIVVKITATDKYVLTKMSVEFEFEYVGEGLYNKDLAPKMSVEMTCGGVNSTERGKAVSLSGYTKVSDLRVLFDANAALDSRVEAKSGKFTLNSQIIDQYNLEEEEKYGYNYSHDTQGKLSYTMNYTSTDVSCNISYKNSTATITYPGYPSLNKTQTSTDSVEYDSIQALINYCNFNIGNVTNIQTVDASKGKYRFVIGNVDTDLVEDLGLVDNPKGASCSQYFDFTVKDGVLVSYEFKLTARSSYATGTYTVKCTFS